ncbi:hypothetical protein EVAR_33445_1 [Eumeta japonica]|uniref:Uncharacterized protein n=1 Tax=Eumeta variegata TaxID=151549 RepID=A0A4C1W0F9_EUMVA|nr:hypothetical protein EVAR_33445_1 [Eumeta japonica]
MHDADSRVYCRLGRKAWVNRTHSAASRSASRGPATGVTSPCSTRAPAVEDLCAPVTRINCEIQFLAFLPHSTGAAAATAREFTF